MTKEKFRIGGHNLRPPILLLPYYFTQYVHLMTVENASILIPDEIISNKIFLIREVKVMLDKDLAELYGVTTGNLNKAVKRNTKRFPDDFMFQLNKEEFEILKFQIGISSWGGTRSFPFAFTEQGIAMLSGILNSDRAILVNIQIMRIFTRIRQMLTDTLSLKIEIEEIKKKLQNQDKNIEVVFSYLDELITKQEDQTTRKRIGYKTIIPRLTTDPMKTQSHQINIS